ncbi:hypothetical protein N7504_004961 [Penicillium tannophilum]|nr:hypothetical protein N7504_004961 [Penicillium tannophilum]
MNLANSPTCSIDQHGRPAWSTGKRLLKRTRCIRPLYSYHVIAGTFDSLPKLPDSMARGEHGQRKIKTSTNIYTTGIVYGEVHEEDKFSKPFMP